MRQSTRRVIAIVSLVGVLAVIIVSLLPRSSSNTGVSAVGTTPTRASAGTASTERATGVTLPGVTLPGVSAAELASAGVSLSAPETASTRMSADQAANEAQHLAVDLGGAPSLQAPVLAHYEDSTDPAHSGATVWAVVVAGRIDLPGATTTTGPPGAPPPAPRPAVTRVVLFIDATTGALLRSVGFM